MATLDVLLRGAALPVGLTPVSLRTHLAHTFAVDAAGIQLYRLLPLDAAAADLSRPLAAFLPGTHSLDSIEALVEHDRDASLNAERLADACEALSDELKQQHTQFAELQAQHAALKLELAELKAVLAGYREIPQGVIDLITNLPKDCPPMHAIRTGDALGRALAKG